MISKITLNFPTDTHTKLRGATTSEVSNKNIMDR